MAAAADSRSCVRTVPAVPCDRGPSDPFRRPTHENMRHDEHQGEAGGDRRLGDHGRRHRRGGRQVRPRGGAAVAQQATADAMVAALDASLAKQVGQGQARRAPSARRRSAGSPTTADLDDLADCDLVIESVVEDLAVKKELFRELDGRRAADAILATNTSTLPVIELAVVHQPPRAGVRRPLLQPGAGDVAGRDRAAAHRRRRDDRRRPRRSPSPAARSPSRCEDRAGFIVNALLFPYLNNAVRMLEHGTASLEDIDTAMKGGCNFPMGPFALLDLVGLDTSVAILDALYEEFRDPNYAAVPTAAPHGVRRPARPQVAAAASTRTAADRPLTRRSRPVPMRPAEYVRARTRTAIDHRAAADPLAFPAPGRRATTWSASAPTSNRARCWPPTGGACSRCRSAGAASAGGRPTRAASCRSTACGSPGRCAGRCAATSCASTPSFRDVMAACGRPDRPGGWITPGVHRRLRRAARARLGPQRRGVVARRRRSSVASTAWPSPGSSPASRCSATPSTPPRWPSSGWSTTCETRAP